MYFDIATLQPIDTKQKEGYIVIHNKQEPSSLYAYFDEATVNEILHHTSIRYEDHLQFDMVCVWQNLVNGENENSVIYIFVCEQGIHFVGEENFILQFIENEREVGKGQNRSIGLLLHRFILMLGNAYSLVSNEIENEITVLENEILETLNEDKNYSKRILHYRKQLLLRKRHFEQNIDLVDGLLDNNNNLYDTLAVSRLTILKDRLSRMLAQVISLLEYVTEVREALQSAMDTKQNKIMSLFTVITSIFLPLTLIVGWYGMNFKMPEFASDIAYPIVIVISVFVVLFCLFYFKKKKWF